MTEIKCKLVSRGKWKLVAQLTASQGNSGMVGSRDSNKGVRNPVPSILGSAFFGVDFIFRLEILVVMSKPPAAPK
jgi:hypothetical protein